MATFEFDLNGADSPLSQIRDIEMTINLPPASSIWGKMVKAGAKEAAGVVKARAPGNIAPHVKTTKVYATPSDGGINCRVYFSGYLPFSNPNRKYFSRSGGNGKTYRTTKGVPADFIAILYEYGRSTYPFPKKPFFRSAMAGASVEEVMLAVQREVSKGLLNE